MDDAFERAKSLGLVETVRPAANPLAQEAYERAKAWELDELVARIKERTSCETE